VNLGNPLTHCASPYALERVLRFPFFRFCADFGGGAETIRFSTLSKASSLSSVWNVRGSAVGTLTLLIVTVPRLAIGSYQAMIGVPSTLCRRAILLFENCLFKQLKKALIERALGAELTERLGYEKGDPAGRSSGNSRNGTSSKTVLTEDGEIEILVPRDRAGSFEPQLIGKGQTRFDGFDDKILSLYAYDMTVREIQGHLAELYGTEVSPDLISRVTDAVLDEVREWQTRPLDRVYAVVFLTLCGSKCATRAWSRKGRVCGTSVPD
jgi:Transposase, Mutator family